MKKFPKVRYPNDSETDGLLDGDVVVTEKLDGANFRFTWDDDGTLHVGTRNCYYEDALNNENFPHAFKHAVEYLTETVPDDAAIETDGVLYGESMHLHSLDYEDIDWDQPSKGSAHVPLDSEIPNVVVFDYRRDDEWEVWYTVEETAETLGLETVPVLERGDPDDCSFEVPDESVFGGPPEGIVVRRLDGSVRAKKVTEDFKETNAVSFNDPSKAQSDAAEFTAMFVTEARVEKIAHKLVDEGAYEQVEMPMMEDLPIRVLQDVMDEEGWNLLSDEYNFECEFDSDFKGEVRSKTSKKCARVLKSMCNSL